MTDWAKCKTLSVPACIVYMEFLVGCEVPALRNLLPAILAAMHEELASKEVKDPRGTPSTDMEHEDAVSRLNRNYRNKLRSSMKEKWS